MIEPKAKLILEETFQDVLTMLGLPPLPYTFVYEKMGGRFLTMENSEEVDNTNHIIYVNEEWANAMLKDCPYDLYYLQAHEARHVYQHMQVILMRTGGQPKEDRALVVSWMVNIQNYQRNLGGNTVLPYQRQPVEVDANAFANFYVLVKGIGGARVPAESDDLVTQRLKEIAAQYGMVIK